MEPFTITCVTCQSRLTVRKSVAIGQILACPKCGSMVQVTAPPEGAANAAASAAAPATAPPGRDVPTPRPSAPAKSATVKSATIKSAAPPPGSAPIKTPVAPTASAAPTRPAAPAEPVVTAFDDVADVGVDLSQAELPPAPPRGALPTAKAASAGQAAGAWNVSTIVAMLAASVAVGSVLVVGAMSLLQSDPAPATATATATATAPNRVPPAATAATVDADRDAPSAPEAPRDDAAATPNDRVAAPEFTAPGASDDPFAPPATTAAEPLAEAGASEPQVTRPGPTDPAASPPINANADADATAASEAAASATPRLRIDPLQIDPEGLDLASLLAHREPASPATAALEAAEATVAAPPSEAPAEAEARAAPAGGEAPRVEPAAPPAAPAVLLARKYPAVKIERMPLARFLDFATTLSAVPVSVAPDELRLAAASASAPISVDAADATIEQILTAAFKSLRLVPVVESGQIVLKRALNAEPKALAYPVDDLVDGDATELARWVQDLVAPESWQAHGGAGELAVDGETLRINASERVGYETILLLERYRVARGLAPRSKYPKELLAAGADLSALDARLTAPATFTFLRPTPAREAFRWWSEELGVAVLADWPALAEQRLAPTARLTASATGQPWSEALDAVLNPLGLAWRAVDAGTIEITTLDKVAQEPEVQVYRLSDGAPTDQAKILSLVNRADVAAAFLDAEDRVLMLRAPARVQRGLRAGLAREGWLAAGAP